MTWCPAGGRRAGAGEGKSIAKTNDREDHIMETLRAAATQGRLFLQTHTLQINNLVSVATRAEGIKLFPDFHHFARFIQYIYVCRFRKSLYEIPSFPQKSENPLQKVSDLL